MKNGAKMVFVVGLASSVYLFINNKNVEVNEETVELQAKKETAPTTVHKSLEEHDSKKLSFTKPSEQKSSKSELDLSHIKTISTEMLISESNLFEGTKLRFILAELE